MIHIIDILRLPKHNPRKMFTNNVSNEAGLKNRGARQAACSGFSLVEVVLAIGIASFSLLVIFSLMGSGVSTLQSSSNQIVETEIFNKIGAEYRQPIT